MQRTLATVVALVLMSGPGLALAGDFRDTLLVLDQQFCNAAGKGDAETLGRLLGDDYVGIDQEGHRWSKAELLARLKVSRVTDLRRTGEREIVRLTEHSAVLTYAAQYKVRQGEQAIDTGPLRMSACWVQRDGGWFVVFSQVSTLPSPPTTPSVKSDEPRIMTNPKPTTPDRFARHKSNALEGGGEMVATLKEKKAFAVGDIIQFDLAVRNGADHAVDGWLSTESIFYTPPTVEDAEGKAVKVSSPTVELLGVWAILPYHLETGETKALSRAMLEFRPDGPVEDADHVLMHFVAHAGPGTYKVKFHGAKAVDVEVKAR